MKPQKNCVQAMRKNTLMRLEKYPTVPHFLSSNFMRRGFVSMCRCTMTVFYCFFLFQITELVHQRDITRMLMQNNVSSNKSFDWLMQMRLYFDPKNPDVLQQLSIQMANAKFNYGFEYLGVQDKLVQTPLTDRCYLTMTQALEARLGGSPFGKIVTIGT